MTSPAILEEKIANSIMIQLLEPFESGHSGPKYIINILAAPEPHNTQ